MRITRLFTPQALTPGASITLDAQASHHLIKVLRHRATDPVLLFPGDGREYSGTIITANSKQAEVLIDSLIREEPEPPLSIHLGICVSRGDRMDQVIQKSTELGVARITPLYSERTGKPLSRERQLNKCKHWSGIARSASEQSGRCRVPDVFPILTLAAWVNERPDDLKLVLNHRATSTLTDNPPPRSVAVLIGPEGGLADAEIAIAGYGGFETVSLGPRVLRTETAPSAVIAILQHMWGDMSLHP